VFQVREDELVRPDRGGLHGRLEASHGSRRNLWTLIGGPDAVCCSRLISLEGISLVTRIASVATHIISVPRSQPV